jgi:hypothetical protein
MACTCPTPFGEDDLICRACEDGEIELYLQLNADQLPTGAAWDAFTRQQG